MFHKKSASGAGTIRKRTILNKMSGKEYTYWEGRYTVGNSPGTGRQIQKTITGKTQKEVSQALKKATSAIDEGMYVEPSKLTLGAWLEIWLSDYISNKVKPNTLKAYRSQIESHIKPSLGATKLQALRTHSIQRLYNSLLNGADGIAHLSPKTIKNCHGVLHKALTQAVKVGYLSFNPATFCELPRQEKKQIQPLDEEDIKRFLRAIESEPYKNLFMVALFTGIRQGELLGLQWSCVNLDSGNILINKQLQKLKGYGEDYVLASTKSGNSRTITAAQSVIAALQDERLRQAENRLRSYGVFRNDNDLVFTDELGKHLVARTVVKHFKQIAGKIGIPEKRFHDLRHSYATMALKSGDSIKEVQTNLGHSTAQITLDLYSHVTAEMKKASAERMEQFIRSVSK